MIHNLSIARQRFHRYPCGGRRIHARSAPRIERSSAFLVAGQRARWLLLQLSHELVAFVIHAALANRVHAVTSLRGRLRCKQPLICQVVIERHLNAARVALTVSTAGCPLRAAAGRVVAGRKVLVIPSDWSVFSIERTASVSSPVSARMQSMFSGMTIASLCTWKVR